MLLSLINYLVMDSQLNPDNVVRLRTSLEEGSPIPLFMMADIRSRPRDTDIVVATTNANVRLTTRDAVEERPNERTLTLPDPSPVVDTIYPGIKLNNRFLTHKL